MYAHVDQDQIDIFHEPARLIFAGFSGSGKSYLLSKLLNKYKHKFSKIIVVGSNLENVSEVDIVRNDKFDPFEIPIFGHHLVIYDDILMDKNHLSIAAKLFTKGRHGGHPHSNGSFSVVFITQNLFHADKNYRSLALNSTGIFLLKQRDLRQIKTFARTFLEKESVENFVKLYKNIISERYGYVYIDYTKPADNALALRGNLAGEGYEIAYKL